MSEDAVNSPCEKQLPFLEPSRPGGFRLIRRCARMGGGWWLREKELAWSNGEVDCEYFENASYVSVS